MSLRWKIAAALASLAAIVAALSAGASYLVAANQLSRSIDESLIERTLVVLARPARPGQPNPIDPQRAPGADPSGPNADEPFRCPGTLRLGAVTAAQTISTTGEVLDCSGGTSIPVDASDLALATGNVDVSGLPTLTAPNGGSEIHYSIRRTRIGGDPARVLTVVRPGAGSLRLARSTVEAARVLSRLGVRLLMIAAVTILAAAGVGFLLATRIVRPITLLTQRARHIAETGDLSTTIPGSGTDEIGVLASSLSTMVDSLALSRAQQQQLISDASHEMRTPLTSLRTNVELLARAEQQPAGRLPASERAAMLDDLRFETNELATMLTELVELATDQRASAESVEAVDLEPLCATVVERAVRRSGRDIVLQATDPATGVSGRPHQLERALMNLIENAAKYSPAPGVIEVGLSGGTVSVRDHGPGIDPVDLPRVFDRFYRATSARTQPGSGLGLAIVEQIVSAHNGTVFVHNDPDGGAVVGFNLPAAPAVDARSAHLTRG